MKEFESFSNFGNKPNEVLWRNSYVQFMSCFGLFLVQMVGFGVREGMENILERASQQVRPVKFVHRQCSCRCVGLEKFWHRGMALQVQVGKMWVSRGLSCFGRFLAVLRCTKTYYA